MTCICGSPIILYWIKDEIWQAAATAATGPGGHLCLDCAAKVIRRPLTLHDLAVSNYLRTTQHNNLDFMRQYTRATIVGAFNETGTPIPENWTEPTVQPHLDALKIGQQLAQADCRSKGDLASTRCRRRSVLSHAADNMTAAISWHATAHL